MTSKPDSVSTLGYHWTDHTGKPLEPQVHWDATGTTLADTSTQWCPSGNPVLICIIGTHWKTTGKPLEDHWKHIGTSPMAFQCTLGSKFQAHWIATGLPLEDHWLRVRESLWTYKHIAMKFYSKIWKIYSPWDIYEKSPIEFCYFVQAQCIMLLNLGLISLKDFQCLH